MASDLDLYSNGGQVQPYQPGGDLAPVSPHADSWGNTPVDYLDDRFERGFGQLDPAVEANVQALASAFETDFQGLGYVQKDIDLCIGWFRQSLANPPTTMPRKNHGYQLFQFSFDPAMNHFAVFARQHKLSQQMVQSVCYWVQQAEDLMNGVGRFAGVQHQQTPVSSNVEDQLSDSQYEAVLAANERAIASTLGYLRDLWGSSYDANLALVKKTFAALPVAEQEHLSQFSSGWIKASNTPEVLLGLYRQAIGAGSLPKSGAEISREIASIENVMKTNRKEYMRDDQLQARYRELLRMRGY